MAITTEIPKSEKTRQYIIERAAPIFNKKGYAGTSLSDLTQATGLTKGSIYGNFKNKDEVALHSFKHNVDIIINAYTVEMSKVDTCLDKLLVFSGIYRKMYQEIQNMGGCPILNTLVEADDTHFELHAQAVKILNLWKKGIVQVINKGIKNKEIKSSTDSEKIAGLIISLIEGGGVMTKTTGEDSYILHALDHVESVIHSIVE